MTDISALGPKELIHEIRSNRFDIPGFTHDELDTLVVSTSVL